MCFLLSRARASTRLGSALRTSHVRARRLVDDGRPMVDDDARARVGGDEDDLGARRDGLAVARRLDEQGRARPGREVGRERDGEAEVARGGEGGALGENGRLCAVEKKEGGSALGPRSGAGGERGTGRTNDEASVTLAFSVVLPELASRTRTTWPSSPESDTNADSVPHATAATREPPPHTPPASCCSSVKVHELCEEETVSSATERRKSEEEERTVG